MGDEKRKQIEVLLVTAVLKAGTFAYFWRKDFGMRCPVYVGVNASSLCTSILKTIFYDAICENKMTIEV